MALKNIPENQRPREKAMLEGVDKLSDSELIAILLRNGTIGTSVIELANKLLIDFKGLSSLLMADISSLLKIKGINMVKAIQLKTCYEIATRLNKINYENHKITLDNPKAVYKRYSLYATSKQQEIFYVIYLNVKLQIIKEETLFSGGINYSIVDLKLVFKNALSCNASKIICFHNHPTGEALPSNEDIIITKQLIEMSKIVNIRIVDHIIIGKGEYYSIIENKHYFEE